jgi:hypothetical protein
VEPWSPGKVGDPLDVDLVVAFVGEVRETGDGRADPLLAGAGFSQSTTSSVPRSACSRLMKASEIMRR